MQFALRAGYYLAWWCIVTALSLLAAAVPFMGRQSAGIDDAVIWFVGIPVGLLLFAPVARRALRFRLLHRTLLGIGGVGCVAAIALGFVLLRRSGELTGVAGPFAGAGELVVAGFCFVAGLFFVAVAVAGATGIKLEAGARAG
jgi:hypothetical protein